MSPYCSEGVQVVHYAAGQKYDAHNDWFQPDTPYYHDKIKDRGNRIVSVFCYLSDVPPTAGGATHFPLLGLRFLPRRGCALLWYNQRVDGDMDGRVLHAGEPVSSEGDKWGMNIWMRERPAPSDIKLRPAGPSQSESPSTGNLKP